ncbi:cyclin-A1 isoform X2 [Ooceraea biroi]|uniref:cyclin-A1 isoform X2 n=1 Tax=Ooceraea biroi TaxID=2015173 RepID=UPI0005BE1AF7|nr:cyclin-A1 isoform X2 [Ooceraea biroi]
MATTRMHQEDQENHTAADPRGRGKENYSIVSTHTQALQQQNKRSVLGPLHNNFLRNVTKPEICKEEKNIKPKSCTHHESLKIYKSKTESNFQIYEDNSEREISVQLTEAHLKEKRETEIVQETVKITRSEREYERLEADTSVATSRVAFLNTYKEDDQKKQDDDLFKDSPMSLGMSAEKSASCSTNTLKDEFVNNGYLKREKVIFDVEEYRDDIYNYLRISETLHRPKPGYMKKQPDITYSMRSILIDWLVEVVQEYRLHNETLYLAVSYIDRFLSYMSVVRSKLQLVGAAAMFIAAKYEEIYPPDVNEFVYITDDTYTKTQVIRMENLILRVLAFDLTVPTPLTFLMKFCVSNNLSDKIRYLAMYLPSHLAASAIALARHTLHEEIWPEELELSTGYSLKNLTECISHLDKTFHSAPNIRQQAIQEKYRNKKYGHVSLLLPRSTEPVSCEREEESA